MKKSIRHQIVSFFLGFVFLTIGLIILVNQSFLEKFYLNHKKEILITGYETLVKNYDNMNEEQMIHFSTVNNLDVVMIDWNAVTKYTNLREQEYLILSARLFGYIYQFEEMGDTILEKTEEYTIQYNQDQRMKMNFVEIWGQTGEGVSFLLRSPIESIQESVVLSNRFYLMIGFVVAVLGVVVIQVFANRITKPIKELTIISQRMANLDFEAKYLSGGDNEIGILGHNFNQMSETLEKTIGELKTANNELQKDIETKEQVDEMRKEFLSNVSHELKTPIALIQGYAEGLQENINEDVESREFYCEVIIDEANKMNQMVKKLLTLNQLEFGKDPVQMERFDLHELIRGVVQSSRLLADQEGAEILFQANTPLYVWADEFKAEEVLTNYVTNAIHHVKYDKKIDIRCVEAEGKVKVIVFNTGDPIPEEELDKIWIKFYKVDKARTREYGGSGIGLSIVKAIMESMHQSCGVKNFNNGVAFWFTLEAYEKQKTGENK